MTVQPEGRYSRHRVGSWLLWTPVFVAILFLAVSSCATIPKTTFPSGPKLTSLLPSTAFAYASIKVSRNRSLVTEVLKKSGLSQSISPSIVDNTTTMYAAVGEENGGKSEVSVAADGSFPAGLIGLRLNLNRSWHRNSEPLRWWQEKASGIQIALPSRNLVLFSTGALPTMLSNLTSGSNRTLNPTILHVLGSSDLGVYFQRVNNNLPILGIAANRFPVQSFYLLVNSATSGGADATSSTEGSQTTTNYHGFAAFKMNSERDARLFSVVFKLLIAGSASGNRIKGFPIPLAGAQLAVSGDTIRLNGLSISRNDLADLLAALITGKAVPT